jgi:hypothetical protein
MQHKIWLMIPSTSSEMESFINSELRKTSFENESQEENVKAYNDTKRGISECQLRFTIEVTKENIDLSKLLKALQFKKQLI